MLQVWLAQYDGSADIKLEIEIPRRLTPVLRLWASCDRVARRVNPTQEPPNFNWHYGQPLLDVSIWLSFETDFNDEASGLRLTFGPIPARLNPSADPPRIESLVRHLKDRFTVVIVTHNLAQAHRVSDHTAFFYLGKLVEFDTTERIFGSPREKLTENYIAGRFG